MAEQEPKPAAAKTEPAAKKEPAAKAAPGETKRAAAEWGRMKKLRSHRVAAALARGRRCAEDTMTADEFDRLVEAAGKVRAR